MGGGSLLNRRWCDGCHRTMAPVRSPYTSYRWRGERVMEPIKCIGIIRRPWLIKASGGNLARTPGLHPYSLREVPFHFDLNDQRESGPRFNVSSERQCFLTVYCPRLYTGELGPTQTTGWAPPVGLTTNISYSGILLWYWQCWASYSNNVIYYSLLVTPFKSNIVTFRITFWQLK